MLRVTSKRTGRLKLPGQVNLAPETVDAIHERAERSRRPIGSEIEHLLMVGLCADPEATVYDHLRLFAPVMAPPRKVPQLCARKENIA